MFDFVKFCQAEYHVRLAQSGIPFDPAKRTADEQATADLHFWAVQTQAAFAVDMLLPSAVEGR